MTSAQQHRSALAAGYQLLWYRIESILGQGGFGITYLAVDTNLDQEVAIKEFLPAAVASREQDSSLQPVSDDHADTYEWGLDRFLSEAQTLAKFRHPSIVRVVSVFEENNTAYMVMEYEKGESLEDALKFRHIEGEAALLRTLFPLLDGLALVHEIGFIHRDIKPENIFIRDDGVPVLIDFGSARQAFGTATQTLTSLVTPGYAPFEQYHAAKDTEKQGPWTDIYALGATLYRAVTGREPPNSLSRASAAIEGGEDVLVPALQVGSGRYSEQFLRAIDKALNFLPERRPQSLSEWREMLPGPENAAPPPRVAREHESDIETLVRSTPRESDSAPPELEQQPLPVAARRGPLAWVAGGAAVCVVLLVAALLLIRTGERTEEVSDSLVDNLTTEVLPAEVPLEPVAEEVEAPKEPKQPKQPAIATEPDSVSPAESDNVLDSLNERLAKLAIERKEREKRRLGEERKRAESQQAQLAKLKARRAQRERIDRLLALADADMSASRLTTPAGDNALERYQTILELEPDNADAHRGLEGIVERYVGLADRAMEKDRFGTARELLERADSVMPDSAVVFGARQSLERRESEVAARQERLEEQRRAKALAEELARQEQAELARLSVRSNVSGYTLFINGQAWTSEDAGGIELSPGTYTVRVEKAGHEPVEKRTILTAGDEQSLQFVLVPLQATVVAAAPSTPKPGLGPGMVRIEGGCFVMGSPASERGRKDDERQHRVCVEDFAIGRHEVTVADFQRFVEAAGYRTEAEQSKGCYVLDGKWAYDSSKTWRKTGFPQDGLHPAVCVSWNDAHAYIDWLGRETDWRYRLPTEGEWEYAARGGNPGARFWGTDRSAACAYASVADSRHNTRDGFPCDDGYEHTAPVGSYRANGLGLYDMLGNVWEWTCSRYDPGYRGSESHCSSRGERGPRAGRGGSWDNKPKYVRLASRGGSSPSTRNSNLGFRLAQDL